MLSPFWMETLIIKNIFIYGNIEVVQENPPGVVLEVWNIGNDYTFVCLLIFGFAFTLQRKIKSAVHILSRREKQNIVILQTLYCKQIIFCFPMYYISSFKSTKRDLFFCVF